MAITLKSKGDAKSAAKRGPGRPKGSTNKPKTETAKRSTAKAKSNGNGNGSHPAKGTRVADGTRRSSKTDMSQRELNAYLKPLAKAAKNRDELNAAWKEALRTVNPLVVEALDAGVPLHLVVDHANITRQHAYGLVRQAREGKLTNGNGNAKPAAKRGRPVGSKNRTGSGRAKVSGNDKPKTTSAKKRATIKAR